MSARDSGQATVELALALPVLVFLVAALVELGLVSVDQVRLWHAAREAARVAAVDGSQEDITAAARRVGIDPESVDIQPEPAHRVAGEPVTVALTYFSGNHIPLIGHLVRIRLSASATMRIEVP